MHDLCPKCGSPARDASKFDVDRYYFLPGRWLCCTLHIKDCRIKELETALVRRNAQLGVACLKHDLIHALACAGCYSNLKLELEEAKEATRVARETNAMLREEGGLQLEHAAIEKVCLEYKRERDEAQSLVVALTVERCQKCDGPFTHHGDGSGRTCTGEADQAYCASCEDRKQLRDSVLALSEVLSEWICADSIENQVDPPDSVNPDWSAIRARSIQALSNSSATAQRVRAEIEREAVEKAGIRVGSVWVNGRKNSLIAIRAAILGEKEKS